ncbi:MAG: EAL domain-containing protein [Acidimicrobiales bacterium]
MTHEVGAGELQTKLQLIEATQLLVRQIVADFVHSSVDDFDGCVDAAFARLGAFLDVDRIYAFEVINGALDNTHEWCAGGVSPEIDNLQAVPLEVCSHWFTRFALDEEVFVPDVSALPDDRRAEREVLEPQGIKSLLVVPLRVQSETIGFIGFDAVRAAREFSAIEVGLLRSLADVITSAIIRQRADEQERRAQAQLRAMTRYSADHALLMDADGMVSAASESWSVLGVRRDDLLGRGWLDLVPVESHETVRAMLAAASEGFDDHRRDTIDVATVLEGSGPAWLEIVFHDLPDEPEIGGVVMCVRDVTNRKLAEQDRILAVQTDALTGLGSRAALEAELEAAMHRAAASGSQVGVLFVDVDRFKLINDSHGHATGDLLLAKVGERLQRAVRSGSFVARFGGDEFVVIVEDVTSFAELEALADRLQDSFRTPIDIGGLAITVTASIGIATGDTVSAQAGPLLRDADTAMYRAKDAGRDRYALFDDCAREEVVRRNEVMQRLPLAIEQGLIVPHLQSIVEIETGRVVGAEALARWDDPVIGTVSPDEFIAVAEETGLIVPLGLQMLDQALALAAGWPERFTVSVNLSPVQLSDPDLAVAVADLLRHHDITPSRLYLEVTESSVMSNLDRGIELLHQLRSLGLLLAMDDFGTGFSSLSMLRRLPVDVLKIDRTFVSGDDGKGGKGDPRLVRAVIGLAQEFGMVTLAEGIETEAQRKLLWRQGCKRGQGWLFGRPVTPEEFQRLIRRHDAARA